VSGQKHFLKKGEVSIPYSSGKNCKTGRDLPQDRSLQSAVSIPYSSGKNCKGSSALELTIAGVLLFQSLIHQGKIASFFAPYPIPSIHYSRFNPLFIREKLQEVPHAFTPTMTTRGFNPLFIREKLQVPYETASNQICCVLAFQSLIHQGKIASQKDRRKVPGLSGDVSIPYSSGKNCKIISQKNFS